MHAFYCIIKLVDCGVTAANLEPNVKIDGLGTVRKEI